MVFLTTLFLRFFTSDFSYYPWTNFSTIMASINVNADNLQTFVFILEPSSSYTSKYPMVLPACFSELIVAQSSVSKCYINLTVVSFSQTSKHTPAKAFQRLLIPFKIKSKVLKLSGAGGVSTYPAYLALSAQKSKWWLCM